MSNAIVWQHLPDKSVAEWKGMTLTVRPRDDHNTLWRWEVRRADGNPTRTSSSAADRIGACADADRAAFEMWPPPEYQPTTRTTTCPHHGPTVQVTHDEVIRCPLCEADDTVSQISTYCADLERQLRTKGS